MEPVKEAPVRFQQGLLNPCIECALDWQVSVFIDMMQRQYSKQRP